MKIGVASDHRGLTAKEKVKVMLKELGHEVSDFGVNDPSASDYPDTGYPAARATSRGEVDLSILFCGSGIGMSIVANKVHGVRAALCHDELSAEMSRRHNDSNVLCLAADLTTDALMRRIVNAYLNTGFEGGRHQRRVEKISGVEAQEDNGGDGEGGCNRSKNPA